MKNSELQKLLKQYPDNTEVEIFVRGSNILRKITQTYIGNEKYLPGNNNKNASDRIILECK